MTYTGKISEAYFISQHMGPLKGAPRVIQIGANEGRFEYAKPDGKDFLFDFLHENPHWDALLIEPIPHIFNQLRCNYARRPGGTHFMNCAITENVEDRELVLSGKDGKGSSLIAGTPSAESETVNVQCLTYRIVCRLVNWAEVDFVKIDAEGYDEVIVHQIIDSAPQIALPPLLMWEQIGQETLGTTDRLASLGYAVFETGMAKNGNFLDRVAIKRH